MKKVFILLFILSGGVVAQDWFPLEVGNQWQFIKLETDDSTYSILNIEITEAFLLKNKKFFRYDISNFPPSYYDHNLNKLYLQYDSGIHLEMDFSLAKGSKFSEFSPYYYCIITEPQSVIFDNMKPLKGYRKYFKDTYDLYYSVQKEVWYAANIGIVYIHDEFREYKLELIDYCIFNEETNTFIDKDTDRVLFQPESDSTSIDKSMFIHRFDVYHPDSKLDSEKNVKLNFIEKIEAEIYYSNGSESIPVYKENVFQKQSAHRYVFAHYFERELADKGYNLFYRFSVNDKSINPKPTYQPSDGWYEVDFGLHKEIEKNVPYYKLLPNYPNPFNPKTEITYLTANDGVINLIVYNQLGEVVTELVNDYKSAGEYSASFDGSNLPSGIYFYKLTVNNYSETRKMVLLK